MSFICQNEYAELLNNYSAGGGRIPAFNVHNELGPRFIFSALASDGSCEKRPVIIQLSLATAKSISTSIGPVENPLSASLYLAGIAHLAANLMRSPWALHSDHGTLEWIEQLVGLDIDKVEKGERPFFTCHYIPFGEFPTEKHGLDFVKRMAANGIGAEIAIGEDEDSPLDPKEIKEFQSTVLNHLTDNEGNFITWAIPTGFKHTETPDTEKADLGYFLKLKEEGLGRMVLHAGSFKDPEFLKAAAACGFLKFNFSRELQNAVLENNAASSDLRKWTESHRVAVASAVTKIFQRLNF